MHAGSYVKITRQTEQWESDGSETEDRASLIDHVGIVLDVDKYELGCALVRFPKPTGDEGHFAQLWVELDALEVVSEPATPISDWLWENC